jgi:nitrile hydratase accessory protein
LTGAESPREGGGAVPDSPRVAGARVSGAPPAGGGAVPASPRVTGASVSADLAGLPRDAEGPVFREPWEAQAFALAVALHERGLFNWPEWADALAAEIARAGDDETGEDYYRHWLAALERLLAERGVTDAPTLSRYRTAWGRAADRTPHGTPIELAPRDFE